MAEQPCTIDQLVRQRAAEHGAKPMVIQPVKPLNYAELDSATREMAAAFVAAGVTKGTRVGLIMPNGVRWVRTAMALTRIGAVLVPLSTLLAPPELVAQLRVASVQALVAVEEFRGHRYHDDLAADLRSLQELPALRRVWKPDQLPDANFPETVDAITDTVTRSE